MSKRAVKSGNARVFVTALTIFMGLVFVGQMAWAHSAVEPADRLGQDWWKVRHEGVLERVKQGNVDLILLGDSINHGWDGAGKTVWDQYYANRNAVNMGFSGDRTQHVLWRIDNGEFDGIQPKLIVMMIGTNNFSDNTAEEIGEGISAIVKKLREKLPETKILIEAIFPRNEKPDDVRERLARASLVAKELADNHMVYYIDFNDRFLLADGTLPKDVMPDFLHPNELGYRIWAAAIEPMVAKLLGDQEIVAVAPPAGFMALFNGADLTNWKGLVEDPEKRAKMTAEELAAAQATADEQMRAHWTVQDGLLCYDGGGNSLCTAKDYGDFEMYVDWKIESHGDSGIYLRGSPQVQIWDPAQWPVGSGGLYNNQKNPKDPLVCADNPIGEWNTFRIKMVGENVSVWLNGALVVDNVVLENYWNRSKPIYPTGQIELQHHNSTLWFRNIYIREL
ncbi:MAG TPA: DUF1080 domain-containing protein [Candidatus Hydrogenedentes bacterium]|nr:DUF1080 domain-containing protein [Candidatus Hydrogenedentota bacterium]HPG66895.1 DUF1080 domain-containing protein [Candidatus Hydrogenedentota bacterium]